MSRTKPRSGEPTGPRARFSGLLRRIAVLIAGILACGEVRARDNQGFVFVGTNEGGVAGHNAIRTFQRDSHVLLIEARTSPTPTGGTGVHPTADLTLAIWGRSTPTSA